MFLGTVPQWWELSCALNNSHVIGFAVQSTCFLIGVELCVIYYFSQSFTFFRAFMHTQWVSEGTKCRSNQKKQENRFSNEQRIVYLVVLIGFPLPVVENGK